MSKGNHKDARIHFVEDFGWIIISGKGGGHSVLINERYDYNWRPVKNCGQKCSKIPNIVVRDSSEAIKDILKKVKRSHLNIQPDIPERTKRFSLHRTQVKFNSASKY